MKKKWSNLILLCLLLVVTGALAATGGERLAANAASAKAGGMPGRPIPENPIPHHEPGQPVRMGNVRQEVVRTSLTGVEETVELNGMDALLAGTMSDPFAGNYDVVNLDQVQEISTATSSPKWPS